MTEKSLAMRVRTRYSSREEFVSAHGQYFDQEGMFVRTPQKKAPGTLVRFEFQLSDGQLAFCGEGLVSDPIAPISQDEGLYLKLTRLDQASKALFSQILSQRFDQEPPANEEEPQPAETPLPAGEVGQEWTLTSADLELIAESIDNSLDSVLLSKEPLTTAETSFSATAREALAREAELTPSVAPPRVEIPALELETAAELEEPAETETPSESEKPPALDTTAGTEAATELETPATPPDAPVTEESREAAALARHDEEEGISDEFEIIAAGAEGDEAEEADLPEMRTVRFVQEEAETPVISDLIADLVTEAPAGRPKPVLARDLREEHREPPSPKPSEPDMADLLAQKEPEGSSTAKPKGFFKRLFGRKG